ncbi:hypothetical protein MN608_09579 [Microdochium nivale]|nr:hypothetical protein MN608_09579 [Microdochium nivale]
MSSTRENARRPRTSLSPPPASPAKRSRDDGNDRHHKRVRTRHRDQDEGRRGHDDDDDDDNDNHHRRHHRHHHRHKPSSSSAKPSKLATAAAAAAAPVVELPFSARRLSYKTDLGQFRPVLARYLDVQKQRDMYDGSMDEREIRGRWKSFVAKWNAGELAQGWYDPDVYATAVLEDQAARREAAEEAALRKDTAGDGGSSSRREGQQQQQPSESGRRESAPSDDASTSQRHDRQPRQLDDRDNSNDDKDEEDDDDSDYGPVLPGTIATTTTLSKSARSQGPGIPTLQDLHLRRETSAEAAAQDRQTAHTQLRADRQADRTLQRERLDELAGGRADPGSHERKLEKKREVNNKMRAFRDNKSPGPDAVDDSELMGGGAGGDGDGGLAEYKRQKAAEQRRKTDREIRREEEARARDEERAERLQSYKDKEDRTMEVLRELARQRFG